MPPLTREGLSLEEGREALTLVRGWITDRSHPDLLKVSLSFHSERARAKMLYFATHAAALKQTGAIAANDVARLAKAEPERISKLCDKLGLRPAKPRTIKDVEWRAGLIHFEPLKKATSKRHL